MHALRILAVCAALVLAPVAVRAAGPAVPEAAYFGGLISQRLDNVARGDAAGYMAFIHPGLVHIADNGTRRTALEMPVLVRAAAGSALHGKRFAVSDVHVSVRDGLAFVDALVTETHEVAGRTFEGRFRESDVLVRDGDTWKFWRHHETLLPARATLVDGNAADYADYAGRYQFWEGYAENIHHRDGALWVVHIADNTLVRLDPSTNQPVGDPIAVGREPEAVAVGRSAVWVVNSLDDTVSAVDPANGRGVSVARSFSVAARKSVRPPGKCSTASAGVSSSLSISEASQLQRISTPRNR